MDLSATRGPLSLKDRDHRMRNNLCLYCGKPGHKARECKAKQHGNKLAATYDYDPEEPDNELPYYLKATYIELNTPNATPSATTNEPKEPPHV